MPDRARPKVLADLAVKQPEALRRCRARRKTHWAEGSKRRRSFAALWGGHEMLFMVIEHFKDRDALPVYQRFAETGRQLPDGLIFVNSWIEANLDRCFQLMECDDPVFLQEWIADGATLSISR